MDEILMYCYEQLSAYNDDILTEEEYVISMDMVETFLSRYNCYLDLFAMNSKNGSFVIKMHTDDGNGEIVVDNKSISVNIDKAVDFSTESLNEKLVVSGNKFSGNYSDFVYNDSEVQIFVDENESTCMGLECKTEFNEKGIIIDNKLIKYVSNQSVKKIEEAYHNHVKKANTMYNDFLVYDELNIITVDIYNDSSRYGKRRK